MRDARILQELIFRTSDQTGVLAEVTRLLGDMGINLLSVYTHADGETARIHLISDSQTYAREALRDIGFEVSERDVILLELPHRPGFLRRITEALARKEISILELYSTIPDQAGTGVVVFTCTEMGKAVQMLRSRS